MVKQSGEYRNGAEIGGNICRRKSRVQRGVIKISKLSGIVTPPGNVNGGITSYRDTRNPCEIRRKMYRWPAVFRDTLSRACVRRLTSCPCTVSPIASLFAASVNFTVWQVTRIDPAQFPLPLCCMRASCNIEDAPATLSPCNSSAFSPAGAELLARYRSIYRAAQCLAFTGQQRRLNPVTRL